MRKMIGLPPGGTPFAPGGNGLWLRRDIPCHSGGSSLSCDQKLYSGALDNAEGMNVNRKQHKYVAPALPHGEDFY